MLELPEVLTVSSQLKTEVAGRTVIDAAPPNKEHKFCWFNGDAKDYAKKITGSRIVSTKGQGIYVTICFDNGMQLCFNDGVNVRYITDGKIPKTYQMLIYLDNDAILAFTVAMYGGIILHNGDYDNAYYQKSLQGISPFSEAFKDYYIATWEETKPNTSVKAFLATEQRFPGIGNGVLQDILFEAGIHPKRKLAALSQTEQLHLLNCTKKVLKEMTDAGGRDTEKDLYGRAGGYRTKMSKTGIKSGCPSCGGAIVKEAYLGGSVYYCPKCQPKESGSKRSGC